MRTGASRWASPNTGMGTGGMHDRRITSRLQTSVGDAVFSFATEAVRTPTDWQFCEPEHIIVVHQRGELQTMEIEFERGPSGSALPRVGDVWVIPAGRRYAALAQGLSVNYCEIHLPTAEFGDRELTATVRHRDAFALSVVDQMRRCADRSDVLNSLLMQSLAESLRLHFASAFTAPSTPQAFVPAWDDVRRRQIIDYLEDNVGRGVTLDSLADHMEMTVGQFRAAFAATFHSTPYQYLIARRIQRAKHLLAGTRLPIQVIAEQVGFATPSHFAASFRARVGVTAGEYRRCA